MIVRILTEGQFEVSGQLLQELDQADNEILRAIEKGDSAAYEKALKAVLEIIRKGKRISDDELVESDLVFPAEETSLEEARELFYGYPYELKDLG